ncbi:hypothetical protein RRG08_038072 [Elysia crispata]|uniref:Uncharacterized protein n=1 Tax=Elysia crispata TaxID=231223 RepID=A0AAE1DQA9_9GAST|nr:hypothetical protein RRG08_038072 [Elysia crispata]
MTGLEGMFLLANTSETMVSPSRKRTVTEAGKFCLRHECELSSRTVTLADSICPLVSTVWSPPTPAAQEEI